MDERLALTVRLDIDDPATTRLEVQLAESVARIARQAADLGIAERRARIADRQGALITAAFERAVLRSPIAANLAARGELVSSFQTELLALEAGSAKPGK